MHNTLSIKEITNTDFASYVQKQAEGIYGLPLSESIATRLQEEILAIKENKLEQALLFFSQLIRNDRYYCYPRGEWGSLLVTYVLGLSRIDPLEYGLSNFFAMQHLKMGSREFDVHVSTSTRDAILKMALPEESLPIFSADEVEKITQCRHSLAVLYVDWHLDFWEALQQDFHLPEKYMQGWYLPRVRKFLAEAYKNLSHHNILYKLINGAWLDRLTADDLSEKESYDMLEILRPQNFREYAKFYNLFIATGAWKNNQIEYVLSDDLSLDSIISCRQDAFDYLLRETADVDFSFSMAENIRMGKLFHIRRGHCIMAL